MESDLKKLTKELHEFDESYKAMLIEKKELTKKIQNLEEHKQMTKYRRIVEKSEAFLERQKFNKLLQHTKEMQNCKKLNNDIRDVKAAMQLLREQINEITRVE